MSENTRYPAADQQQQQSRAEDGRGSNLPAASQFISTDNSNIVVPTAPYPPMNNYYGMQSAPPKSALSSSPHYITTYGRASAPPSRVGEQVLIAPDSGLLPDLAGTTPGGSFSTATNKNDGGFSSSSKLYNKSNSGNNNINAGSGTNASNVSSGVVHPPQIMFCPGRHDILASINCVSSSSKKKAKSKGDPMYGDGNSSGSSNISGKLGGPAASNTTGPIMMELRRLEVAANNFDSQSDIEHSMIGSSE